MSNSLISSQVIANKIKLIRGKKVMFDRDLAMLYNVPTQALNQAVKRNQRRFPKDFMFQLSKKEVEFLISQSVISKNDGRGGSRKLPFVFTEQGIAMLSGVLHSQRAIDVNVSIMRAFVRLREMMISHEDLGRKIKDLESKFEDHDEKILMIFEAIKQLMTPVPEPAKRKIGFHGD